MTVLQRVLLAHLDEAKRIVNDEADDAHLVEPSPRPRCTARRLRQHAWPSLNAPPAHDTMASSLDPYDLQGDLMTDRYMKVVFTIIALALIWLGVKDTRLEPVVSAQSATWEEQFQDWDENPLALGLPDQYSALPASSGSAYVCNSRLYGGAGFSSYGDSGYLHLYFMSEPNCGGSVIGSGRIYSEGATLILSHSSYLLSEAALMAYAGMTQRAAASGQRVFYYRCSDVKMTCIKALSFRNAPAV